MADSDNPLLPGQGGVPAPQASPANGLQAQPPSPQQGPSLPSAMMQHFHGQQEAAKQVFDKLTAAQRQVRATKAELDKLVAMKDTVTQDDVVKAAGGMVAAGIPAVQVAGILAEMPDNGEALEAWLASKDQKVSAQLDQVNQAVTGARYKLGLSALRHIIAYSAESNLEKKLAGMRPVGRA